MRRVPRPRYGVGFLAGIAAAAVLSALMGLGLKMQWSEVSFETALGSFMTGTRDMTAWWVGFAWHLLNGGIFGLIYAAIFRKFKRVDVPMGISIGVMHFIVGGFLMALFDGIHGGLELSQGKFADRTFFFTSTGGSGAGIALALHLTFGAIQGGLCRLALPQEAIRGTTQKREPDKAA